MCDCDWDSRQKTRTHAQVVPALHFARRQTVLRCSLHCNVCPSTEISKFLKPVVLQQNFGANTTSTNANTQFADNIDDIFRRLQDILQAFCIHSCADR
jgi:hypothetical protein